MSLDILLQPILEKLFKHEQLVNLQSKLLLCSQIHKLINKLKL